MKDKVIIFGNIWKISGLGGLVGEAGKLGERRGAGLSHPEADQQLLPEVVPHQAVHQEVDAGVEDGGEV